MGGSMFISIAMTGYLINRAYFFSTNQSRNQLISIVVNPLCNIE